jgi:hypothetical protein
MKSLFYKHINCSLTLAFCLLLLFLSASNLAYAQVSITATSGTTGPTAYTDLSSAFTAINSGTHQGDIVIDIATSFTDPAISVLNSSGSGSASYNSVLVRPATDGVIINYTSAQGRGMIEMNGSDNVVIDGDNPNSAGINRNLSFVNTAANTITYTSVIRVATGNVALFNTADNITIKNLIINGSAINRNLTGITSATGSENTTFGIVAGPNGGAVVAPLSSVTAGMATGTTANIFTVQNCAINQCARAIAFLGADTTSSTGVIIQNNTIGNQSATLSGPLPYTTPSTTVYTKGIFIQGTAGVTISGNNIKNMVSYVLTPMSAIELSANIGTTTGTISIGNNTINGVIQNSSTANAERGIYVASSFAPYSIAGNDIQNIQGNSPSQTQQPAGIQVTTPAPSATIENNKIAKVYNWNNQSYGVNGIIMSGGSNITVQNNWVSDIRQDMSTASNFGTLYSVYGIKISSGNGHKVYHNTVHLFGGTLGAGVGNSTGTFAFCITANTLTGINVRNNLFSNVITGGSSVTVAHAAIFLPSAGTIGMNLTLNNNAYFCGTVDSINGIAQVGGTAGTGLYKAQNFNTTSITPANNLRAYTRLLNVAGTNDNASIALKTPAPFVSNTDLHIPAGTLTALESTGSVTPLTTDIDGDARPGPAASIHGGGAAPDIGSDESDLTPINLVVDSSAVEQVVSSTLAGTTNVAILKIKVSLSGYVNAPILSSLKLKTTGSSSNADIDSARIYYTGSSAAFSTATPFGPAVGSIASTFYATGSQVLNKGDNYFWLAYDVKLSAGIGNVLDAMVDSLFILGTNYAPSNSNPAGNIVITNPMTYLSSTTTQTLTTKVGQGSVRNQIIGMQVVTSATGTPINVTQLDFNVGSTTDTSAIRNIKIWYTANSNVFAISNRFGDSLITLPGTTTFSMLGTQALTNGINYFWLTYDINGVAPYGTLVDAECTSITVDGNARVPAITAPAGSREVRFEYCQPTYTYSCTGGDFVNNFSTTGATNNISYLASGCNNSSSSFNYNTSQSIKAYKSSAITLHYQGSGAYSEGFKIWVDYNQDGLFDVTEIVASAAASTIMNHSTIIIPCNAVSGITRMRVRDVYNAQPALACANETYGEAEDYDIEIVDNPIHYNSSVAIQQVGQVAPGNTNKAVLRIPVKVSGCGDAVATLFKLNTATSTSPLSNIVSASLYSTGASSVFNINKLIGTVFSPNGAMEFFANDTLSNSDTTNYWLAYDISGGATPGHILDAKLDSIELLGAYYLPTNGNPTGNITISSPMTYVSSSITQPNTSKVSTGSANNQVIKVKVQTSAMGAPVDLSQLDFNVNGTTDTANILNLKAWYTGAVDSFSTTNQFGTTLSHLPSSLSFNIIGTQALLNGDNYFWLSYDVAAFATLGNAIDGECTAMTIDGIVQTPVMGAQGGERLIRNAYCVPVQSGGTLVKKITFATLNNTPVTAVAPYYRVFATADSTTTSVSTSLTYNLAITTAASAILSVWLDYNDDGIFATNEWTQVATSTQIDVASVVPIMIPCSTFIGPIRMRIRSRGAGLQNGAADACTAFGGGETQDYTINIVNTSVSYQSSTAVQQTGNIAPSSTDNPVLRIPISTTGCGTPIVTSFNFNTAGSTNASDILSAKLYVTGTSKMFNTSKQIGTTLFTPNGSFNFTVTDTLINSDTTNYWLAYDVNTNASNNNVLDARFDSAEVLGAYRMPTVNAPAGSLTVAGPMTFVSADVTQSATSFIGQASANNHIIGINVVTSATGSVVNLTQFDFNANGTTNIANVKNVKVWYTAASGFFLPTTQVGATLPTLASSIFNITGSQPLVNGNNYFWLTYDIDSFAAIGNDVDAECLSVYIDGMYNATTSGIATGSQKIRTYYCVPPYGTGCVDGDFVNNFATVGGITNINNLVTGCNTNTNSYIHYPNQTVTVKKGALFTINYQGSGNWDEGHKIWIDYNQDGDFSTNEMVAFSAITDAASTAIITVPMNALEGTTRMRIRNVWNVLPGTACSLETYGETEDYNVTILPAPIPVVYTWNKTAPDSFNLAANWTPTRTAPNLNDALRFNTGGTITVKNVVDPLMSSLEISNNTTVIFNASTQSKIVISDSLKLVSGKVISGNNVSLMLGVDTNSIGAITGSGSIEGRFTRWINGANASYSLPLSVGVNNRNVMLNYTSAPTQSGTLSVSFVSGGVTTAGGLPLTEGAITINKVATTGYWVFDATNGLTGGVYDAIFTAEGFTGITNVSNLVLVKRINATLPWTLQGTHITTTGSNAIPVLSRTGMSGYNEFGIGGDSLLQPLPVGLLSFTASRQNEGVLLNWKTSAEINNKGFYIERSVDGRNFDKIDFVKGAGNSNKTTSYNFLDKDAFAKGRQLKANSQLFYRLKQVDMNDEATYSNIVNVSIKQTSSQAITYLPNPFVNTFDITILQDDHSTAGIEITDISGKQVWSSSMALSKGINTVSVNEAGNWQSGIYFVKIISNGQVTTAKIIKIN